MFYFYSFIELELVLVERLLNIDRNFKDPFSMGFGNGLGQAIPTLSQDVIDIVWN